MIPLIIDTDPGIDDALALFLAAGSPELQLLGVTTVAGNRPVEITSVNACRLLDAAGCGTVPVFAGCARPIASADARTNLVHGADGLGGILLDSVRRPVDEHATAFLARTLRERPTDSVALVAVGPLTNLAMVEILHPGLLQRARQINIMGGAAFCAGNITPSAEFNFYADPIAAHIVLSSGARIHLFGLDVTSRAVMSNAWIRSLGELPTRCGQAAHAMLQAYAAMDPLLHDACPVAHLIDSSLFSGAPSAIEVDWRPGRTEGQSIAWAAERTDAPRTPNVVLHTEVRNDALLDLVRARIAALP
jgi:purine nucleosidase